MELIYFALIIIMAMVGVFYGFRDLLRRPKSADEGFSIDDMWEAINSLPPMPAPMVTIIPTSLLNTEHGPMLREYAQKVPDVHFNEFATEIIQFPKSNFYQPVPSPTSDPLFWRRPHIATNYSNAFGGKI